MRGDTRERAKVLKVPYLSPSRRDTREEEMNTDPDDVAAVRNEFTNALTEVLAENAASPARRGRVARAYAVKKHPEQ